MSQIECYEPEFVRQYIKQHPTSSRSPLAISWQHEIRHSLLLNDYDCCEAVLGSPEAFMLQVQLADKNPEQTALPAIMQALNQAALDVITLPELSVDQRLYALGIMLSFAQKLPETSASTFETIKALPAQLAIFTNEGTLKDMFTQLPALTLMQRKLITHLGSVSFDWDNLIDCQRKMSLPLQISLLSLQDNNSEALMQEQLLAVWNSLGEKNFEAQPWVWTNYLVYRLYHDTFPQHDQLSIMQCYLELASDYFMLRTLFSLWVMDGSALSHSQTISLFSVFEAWRLSPEHAHEREMLHQPQLEDELVSAFSLLIR